MTLAGLFWALDREVEVLVRLIKKVLYTGAFAFIIGNFQTLATAIFNSFATLGLNATATGLTAADLLLPGKLAGTGFTAASPARCSSRPARNSSRTSSSAWCCWWPSLSSSWPSSCWRYNSSSPFWSSS